MNAALTYYNDLRKICSGRRGDFTVEDLVNCARRAAKFTEPQRKLIIHALIDIGAGFVTCPHCGIHTYHESNKHHRIGSLKFTCTAKGCGKSFKATEVTS